CGRRSPRPRAGDRTRSGPPAARAAASGGCLWAPSGRSARRGSSGPARRASPRRPARGDRCDDRRNGLDGGSVAWRRKITRFWYSRTVNLTGDPAGLAALKAFQEGNREYLKFLIQEAKSVFEHHVDFKA